MKVQQVNTQQSFGIRNITVKSSVCNINNASDAILDALPKIKAKGSNQADICYFENINLATGARSLVAKVSEKIEKYTSPLLNKLTLKTLGFAEIPMYGRGNTPLTDKEILSLTDKALADLEGKIGDYRSMKLLREKIK